MFKNSQVSFALLTPPADIARLIQAGAASAANDDFDLCPLCDRTGDEIFACCGGDMGEAA